MVASPDAAPTPEEAPLVDDKARGSVILSRSGLNLHLQERLLNCGNFSTLKDDEDGRLSRRPSISSASSSIPERDSDDGGYFRMTRVPHGFLHADCQSTSQREHVRRGSVAPSRKNFIVGVVGDKGVGKTTLIESCKTILGPSNSIFGIDLL